MAEELLFERFGLTERDEGLFLNVVALFFVLPALFAFVSSIGSDLTFAQELDNDPSWLKLLSSISFFIFIFVITISTLSVATARDDWFLAALLIFTGGLFALFMYSLYTTDSERPFADNVLTFTIVFLLLIFAMGIGEI